MCKSLWDEAIAAYDWWVSVGRPDYSRFGLTITSDGEQHAGWTHPSIRSPL